MKQVDRLLSDYAFYHRTKGNKLCHFVGIPLIIYGILATLTLLKVGPIRITAAELLIVVTGLYYLALDIRLGVTIILVAIMIDAGAHLIGDARIALTALVVGWIFQTIGHMVFEKNRPALFRNLVHVLVGPIFLLNEILHVRAVLPEPAETAGPSR